jgi:hypothetical protein
MPASAAASFDTTILALAGLLVLGPLLAGLAAQHQRSVALTNPHQPRGLA